MKHVMCGLLVLIGVYTYSLNSSSKGLRLFEEKKYIECFEYFEDLAYSGKTDAEVEYYLGQTIIEMIININENYNNYLSNLEKERGDIYELIIKLFKSSIKKDEKFNKPYESLLFIYNITKKHDDASKLINLMNKNLGNDALILTDIGYYYYFNNQQLLAEKYFKLAVKKDSTNIKALINYAIFNIDENNDYFKSAPLLNKAYMLNKKNNKNKRSTIFNSKDNVKNNVDNFPIFALANCYLQTGRYKNAIDTFNEIITEINKEVDAKKLNNYEKRELEKLFANIYGLLGISYAYIKEYEKCLEALEQSLRYEENGVAYLGYAIYNMLNNYDDEALKFLEQVYKKEFFNRLVYIVKAKLLLKLKKYNDALNEIQDFIRLAPNDVEARLLECNIMLKNMQYKQAKVRLEKLIKLDGYLAKKQKLHIINLIRDTEKKVIYKNDIEILDVEHINIFSSTRKIYYKEYPITIELYNNTKINYQNIFLSYEETDYLFPIKEFKLNDSIGSKERVKIKIPLLLKESILKDEDVDINFKLNLSFRNENDSTYSKKIEIPLRVYSKNKIFWKGNEDKIASYISFNSPVVKTFVDKVKNVVNSNSNDYKDRLKLSSYIYSAVQKLNLKYSADPIAYNSANSVFNGTFDYVQYPEETLSKKTGDCDDFTVLFASLLEASGYETEIVFIPGHVFLIYKITDKIVDDNLLLKYSIKKDNGIWLALETTLVSERDFFAACRVGKKIFTDNLYNKKYKTRDITSTIEPNIISCKQNVVSEIDELFKIDRTMDDSWKLMCNNKEEKISRHYQPGIDTRFLFGKWNYYNKESVYNSFFKFGFNIYIPLDYDWGIDTYFKFATAESDKSGSIGQIFFGLGPAFEIRIIDVFGLNISPHIFYAFEEKNDKFPDIHNNSYLNTKRINKKDYGIDLAFTFTIYFSRSFGIGANASTSFMLQRKIKDCYDYFFMLVF